MKKNAAIIDKVVRNKIFTLKHKRFGESDSIKNNRNRYKEEDLNILLTEIEESFLPDLPSASERDKTRD